MSFGGRVMDWRAVLGAHGKRLRWFPCSSRGIRAPACIPVQESESLTAHVTKPKVPALTLEDAKALVSSLYDRAISDDVSHEYMSEVQKLEKLTAKDLNEIAKHFGVVPGKTKKASLSAILEKISRRKATHTRTQF